MNSDILNVGDVLIRTTVIPFVSHYVLYVGESNGVHWVAENQLGYGVRYIPLNYFLNSGKLLEIRHNNLTVKEQTCVLNRIQERIGRQYLVFSFNCEHFVNEVLTGNAHSPQIGNFAFLTLAVGGALVVSHLESKPENVRS